MAATPITFNVPGQRVDGARRGGGPALPPPLGLPGTLGASVKLGAQRAGGQSQTLRARPGLDVVVLHLANGPSLVLHPEAARDLLLAQQGGKRPRKQADLPTTVDVDAQLHWDDGRPPSAARGAERGWASSVLLAGLDVVIDPLKGKAQDHVAGQLVQRIDDQVSEGLYRLSPQGLGPLKGQPVLAQLPAECAGQASLVFVHGTFSTTQTAFGKLWTQHPQRVRALFQHYGQRVFALDHRTLGASPVENALTLARACPAGARLHLMTHSRGGLVAEVLARASGLAQAGAADLALFDAEPATRQALAELVEVMGKGKKGKDIRVERVVRVACPARGTLLASQRLDAWLSVFKWALELANLPVLPELLEFLAGVAQRREDPAKIPGVAAMIPDSALVRWLHAADEPVPGKLFVVAGDLQADSVGSWVKTLLSDAFYRTDHDLVVNTSSMYGGAPREGGASFVLDKGGKVTHFNYFANERTAAAVVAALTQDRPEDYRSIGPLSWAGESASGERAARRAARAERSAGAAGSRPAVFVLPGILGSHLAADGKRIWLGWRLVNGLKRLRYPDAPGTTVTPDGAIGLIYEDLMDHLAASHEVIEFSFDWRRPIEQEAQRLGRAVEQALAAREQSGQPVRLLAHSMGGLVARTMQLECPKVWDRLMAHPGARLLMLGTPNGGSWAPMQCLSGDDSFGNTLVAFGAPFQDASARAMMAQFPGFIQLQAALVGDTRGLDREQTWRDLALQDKNHVLEHHWWHSDERQLATYDWGIPNQAVLDQAKALRKRLDEQRDQALPRWRDKLALVVGRARFTPDGFELGPDGLEYLNTPEAGDGRVPITSALLPQVRTWQLECDHGKLPDDSSAFDAYVELLATGNTSKLPRLADAAQRGGLPAAAAAPVKSRPSRQRQADDLPREDDPLRETLPVDLFIAPPPATLPVSVINGDLKFVRQAMLVGHYRSNSLTGTEQAVDRQVGGIMSASLAMGQYPDEPGTHQVFTNAAFDPDNPWQLPRPEAVMVVGLGAEGELRPAKLSYSVRYAVLAQAQRLVEQPDGAPLQFELAATLLGSGGVGISPGQSAQLVALGVRQADQALAETNARLQAQTAAGNRGPVRLWPRVGRLHLVELFLDRATEAWRALRALGDAMPGQFTLTDQVDFGTGALRRPVDGGYRGAGYDLISALASGPAGDERILYTVDTRRARTEVRAQATQAQLVRELVATASNHAKDDTEIGRTLFQLLVPLELEPYLGSSNEMLLELNPGTAGIPWELLDTDSGSSGQGDHRPWAVRSRLLRKLRLDDFRPGVADATSDCAALVIGEPDCDVRKYPALPGARQEAQAVAERLGGTGALGPDRVRSLIRSDEPDAPGPGAREVIGALLSRPWRIVHIAGHGEPPEVVDELDPDTGAHRKRLRNPRGVVLANDTFLGPREIRNLRVVPELVFINCCHLARRENSQLLTAGFERGDSNPAVFAGTVAEELIRAGVRCVVAAGWAVDDGAAAAFADTLYRALLGGARFIEAVGAARDAAQRLGGNTWAAYQCYGDPDWTLRPGTPSSRRRAQPLAQQFASVASPLSLTLALETLVWQSRYQGAPAAAQLERIRHLEARFGPQWGGMGAVAEAFAVAYDAAGDRAQAIEQYRRAVGSVDGSATLKASEQLANLQVRQAWAQARSARGAAAGAATDAALQAIAQALLQLDRLVAMQPTLERHMLRASAHKRRAMIHLARGRQAGWLAELESMAAECHAAARVGQASGQHGELHYPLANLLAAVVARHAGTADWGGPDEALTSQLRLALQHRAMEQPDFWSVMGQTELRLNLALARRAVQAEADQLANELADLHGRVSATEHWSSVADQLDFLLPGYLKRVNVAGEKAALQRLRDQVNGYAGR